MIQKQKPPLKLQVDRDFTYTGLNDRPATTHLRIYVDPDNLQDPVVVATELHDNPGASITNTIEKLAAALLLDLQEYGYNHFTLIEHYPHKGPVPEYLKHNPGARVDYESFSIVAMRLTENRNREGRRMFSKPEWNYISREQVEELIGQPFPVLRDY